MTQPAIFLAHGAPSLALDDNEYTSFLRTLLSLYPRPKAIVLFSAHWESHVQRIGSNLSYEPVYDFYGFPDELYQIHFQTPGDPSLAKTIQQQLQSSGISSELDSTRGLDHGAWVLLHLLDPDSRIPVVSMSVNPQLSPEEQIRIGETLAPLREQGIMIIGSGGTVHNLRRLNWEDPKEPESWAVEFDRWLEENLRASNKKALLNYREKAPYARDAASDTEHFIPLLLALGAGGGGGARLLHRSYQWGTLSLSAWQFGG
jgi:4,5-DOPA dioxygenase extradiol